MEPQIPGFAVLGAVGSGAMSSVWRAREQSSGRLVALKVLHPHVAATPGLLDRFVHEVRAYERLNHPNVIACLHGGKAGEQWFVALEYLEGGDLRGLLNSAGRLPPEAAALVAAQVLEALAHAHKVGVVHRDVKPENVMIAADGTVKLADFGISTAADFTRLTQAGTLVGTPAYMAPEQIASGEATARSDLWSAGVLLYEMLTGMNPFAADHPSTTLARLASRAPAPPAYRAPGVPERLEEVCLWLLSRDPEARPARAEEAVELLAPVLAAASELGTREGLRGLLAEPAETCRKASRAAAVARLERARGALEHRPPRHVAALFEASEAAELDPSFGAAREQVLELAGRVGCKPHGPLSARALELEREAEDNPSSLAAILNLVRLARGEGDLLLAGRAYRWGRRRSREDRFAFAQLASALGLELAAHLEGLHPEALRGRLQGRGARVGEEAARSRPFWASPAVFLALLALAGFLALDRLHSSASPAPRPPRRPTPSAPSPPDAYAAMLERAAQVADEGDAERAFAIYTLFLVDRGDDPRAAEVRFRVARALEDLDRPDDALSAYQELLRRHPAASQVAAARRRLAAIHEQRRDFDAALAALAPLGRGRDIEDQASLDLQRARIDERRGDFEAALERYQGIEKSGVSSHARAKALLGHGRVLALREDPTARPWLEEAIRLAGEGGPVGREARELVARLDSPRSTPPPEEPEEP